MLKLIKAIVLFIGLLMSGLALADLNSGLIAYWSFDNCDATDSSGNGHNGTKHGTYCVQGRMGNALDFNGVSDYVEIPSGQNLSTFTEMTLSAWVYRKNDLDNVQGIITKWYQYAPNSAIETDQDTYTLSLSNGFANGATNNYFYLSNAVVDKNKAPLNKWFHVIFTHSSVNGGKLYVNGVLKNSNNIGGIIIPSSNPIILGADNNLGTIWRFFQGTIDDARIYNRALSNSEIADLYNAGSTVNGTIKSLATHTVTCKNETTGQVVNIPASKATAYDCESKGLKVNPGETASIFIKGVVQ